MKKLNVNQMEMIEGGFDCSASGQLAFMAGGATAGTLAGGPFGFLGGLAGTLIYSVVKCYGVPG